MENHHVENVKYNKRGFKYEFRTKIITSLNRLSSTDTRYLVYNIPVECIRNNKPMTIIQPVYQN